MLRPASVAVPAVLVLWAACGGGPTTHIVEVTLAPGAATLALPAHTVGVNLLVEAADLDTSYYAGVSSLVDASGAVLFVPPTDAAEYFAEPLRYAATDGSSMVLLPNAPALAPLSASYAITTFAETLAGKSTTLTNRVRLKISDGGSPTSGRIPLHVLRTDTTAACGALDDTARSSFEATLASIFAGAGITVSPILYMGVKGASSITLADAPPLTELDALLATATAGDASDVLELVLVDAIHTRNGDVVGIAGGTPSSTGVPGTPHSGAAVALTALCEAGGGAEGGRSLAIASAHELGHSLGLFHNVEHDGHTSPLGDDAAMGADNLMYWTEDGGDNQTQLSPNQKMVLLANPAVASP